MLENTFCWLSCTVFGTVFFISATRVRQFTLLRLLAVFDLVEENYPDEELNFVRNVFKAARRYDHEKAIGLWQGIPPAIFVRYVEY